jgi:RimJ/RimL family protein N-acetyltransferase
MLIDPRLVTRETKRLLFRMPSEVDVEPWSRWLGDFETVRWMTETPSTPEETWLIISAMLGHWHLRGFGPWSIVEKETGHVVGRGGLWFPKGWPGVEFIIVIGPEARQGGYASEIAEESLRCAFDIVGLDEVLGVVLPWNTRSLKLVERFQFTFIREWHFKAHAVTNIYSMKRADFRRIRGIPESP